MNPISIIVTALAAGSIAVSLGAKQSIKDAYIRFNALIHRKYGYFPSLEALEKEPDSKTNQVLVAADLVETNAGIDKELLDQAGILLDAIREVVPLALEKLNLHLNDEFETIRLNTRIAKYKQADSHKKNLKNLDLSRVKVGAAAGAVPVMTGVIGVLLGGPVGAAVGSSLQRESLDSSWRHILEEELDQLTLGKILFNSPDPMELGTSERIELRISQNINEDLTKALKGRGIPNIETIKVGSLMKARLTGSAFQIQSLNEEEQVLTKRDYTEWAWNVIPDKSGKQVLYLHVTVRIRLPYGEEKKDCPVMEREILVRVNPVYSIIKFLTKYWMWIITALIIPLLGLIWKIYHIVA